ncbi:hypothetical protein WN944_026060 [Citrus x changshan-huyou]|uniref:Uncharacterized protein n=1 Tax=Citrus x changshan-huyou TaxID=2935761 RepID=A0AAP0LRS6_9ROSI
MTPHVPSLRRRNYLQTLRANGAGIQFVIVNNIRRRRCVLYGCEFGRLLHRTWYRAVDSTAD